MPQLSILDEIGRISRVSDMMCSAHSALRDKYERRALVLDLSILALSTWLVAIALIDPKLETHLTPGNLEPRLWSGMLAVFVFLLTLLQLKTDWKARSDAHRQSSSMFAEVKREAGYVLAGGQPSDDEKRRILSRYDMATASGIPIPEADFLKEKRRHRIKMAISKRLDSHPGTSLLLARIVIWCRDNLGRRDTE